MGRRFSARYASASDIRAHLEEHEARGVILLPMPSPPDVGPLEQVRVSLRAESVEEQVTVEVVQILPGAGLVVRVLDAVDASRFPRGGSKALPPHVEEVEDEPEAEDEPEQDAPEAEQSAVQGTFTPAGSSALSWPIEKLQAEWDTLTVPERIRVARYGNRGARMIASRARDKTLQVHLLSNPNISTEEVAAMAGSGALDPAALRRIASNREWLRSSEVTRNLICNPKLPLPEVERLLRPLSQDELARLSKSGRLRAAVRQAIQKRLGKR